MVKDKIYEVFFEPLNVVAKKRIKTPSVMALGRNQKEAELFAKKRIPKLFKIKSFKITKIKS